MSAAFSIFGALTGCIASMTCVEQLAKEQSTSMNLLTFSTFLFTALEGFIFTSKFLTAKRHIPLTAYIPNVAVFFLSNWTNNQALNYHVPVTLHIIFRSGTLLTNMLLNMYLGKRYTSQKYSSVIVITLGIIICTLSSSKTVSNDGLTLEEAEKHYKEWAIGIALLTMALILSSLLAIVQERLYKSHGTFPKEVMFYTHALSLPLFVFMFSDIYRNALLFNQTEPYSALGIDTSIPRLWVTLIYSCIGQYVCIYFVYQCNSKLDSLSVTLVVTLRKFISLLISIFWFGSAFSALSWVGAILVFGGTFAFTYEKKKKHTD